MGKITNMTNDVFALLRQTEGDIEDAVKSLLDSQPYSVECHECGEKLEFSMKLDSDDDMMVFVKPCENCLGHAMKIAVEEAVEEASHE
jgi:Zn finger protein HypA/HybF involved in hydrogenase expression